MKNTQAIPTANVLFICGGLEPGRDGVGDYSRLLAGELISQGNRAAMLAVNDRMIKTVVSASQTVGSQKIQTLRLPSGLKNEIRIELAKAFISEHEPDWLSLQFVIYAFNLKGLPFSLVKTLKSIGADRPWHIMFHELWIGMDDTSGLKNKLIGLIQKRIIKNLLAIIKPKIVHTQTELYMKKLNEIGSHSNYLPLFSNIPVYNLEKVNLKTRYDFPNHQINFILFGHIHPGSHIDNFVNEITSFAKENSIRISLTTIGRNGAELRIWKTICAKYGLILNEFGEQSVKTISKQLANADIGITTTPIIQSEKSGTIAAMRAHGLPIICISKKWKVKNYEPKNTPKIRYYKKGRITKAFFQFPQLRDETSGYSINIVAQILFNDLTKSELNGYS